MVRTDGRAIPKLLIFSERSFDAILYQQPPIMTGAGLLGDRAGSATP
jgi:hypothetical protein